MAEILSASRAAWDALDGVHHGRTLRLRPARVLLTAKRDRAAARRYLKRAINLHGLPVKITIDKSGANTAAIRSVNDDACLDIATFTPPNLAFLVESK